MPRRKQYVALSNCRYVLDQPGSLGSAVRNNGLDHGSGPPSRFCDKGGTVCCVLDQHMAGTIPGHELEVGRSQIGVAALLAPLREQEMIPSEAPPCLDHIKASGRARALAAIDAQDDRQHVKLGRMSPE